MNNKHKITKLRALMAAGICAIIGVTTGVITHSNPIRKINATDEPVSASITASVTKYMPETNTTNATLTVTTQPKTSTTTKKTSAETTTTTVTTTAATTTQAPETTWTEPETIIPEILPETEYTETYTYREEPEYEEPDYNGSYDYATGYDLLYYDSYYVCDSPLSASMGVKDFNGHRETYYSERVLPGYGLNIPGRHNGYDGTVRDEDGYICVAADQSYMPYGTVLLTSLGPAKVYDTGCAWGTIDIYVNW